MDVFQQQPRLRQKGLKVTYDLRGRSMKAQMREANRQNARFVAIAGDDELVSGQVQLKDMAEGVQEALSLDEIAPRVASSPS